MCREGADSMSEWFVTDDDYLQCCRPLPEVSPAAFEFVQIIGLPGHVDGKPFWIVAHAEISVADYTEVEIQSALNFYGYDNKEDFISQNSPDKAYFEEQPFHTQLIAEMLFEIDALPHYGESEHSSWNDAVMCVAGLTQLELSSYMETAKPSLADQIRCAEGRITSFVDDSSKDIEASR